MIEKVNPYTLYINLDSREFLMESLYWWRLTEFQYTERDVFLDIQSNPLNPFDDYISRYD